MEHSDGCRAVEHEVIGACRIDRQVKGQRCFSHLTYASMVDDRFGIHALVSHTLCALACRGGAVVQATVLGRVGRRRGGGHPLLVRRPLCERTGRLVLQDALPCLHVADLRMSHTASTAAWNMQTSTVHVWTT